MLLTDAEGKHFATIKNTMYVTDQVAMIDEEVYPILSNNRTIKQNSINVENAIMLELTEWDKNKDTKFYWDDSWDIDDLIGKLGWDVGDLTGKLGWDMGDLIGKLGWDVGDLTGKLGWDMGDLIGKLGWDMGDLKGKLGWDMDMGELAGKPGWGINDMVGDLGWGINDMMGSLGWGINDLMGDLGWGNDFGWSKDNGFGSGLVLDGFGKILDGVGDIISGIGKVTEGKGVTAYDIGDIIKDVVDWILDNFVPIGPVDLPCGEGTIEIGISGGDEGGIKIIFKITPKEKPKNSETPQEDDSAEEYSWNQGTNPFNGGKYGYGEFGGTTWLKF